jgi:S1-C subfamily serine protease
MQNDLGYTKNAATERIHFWFAGKLLALFVLFLVLAGCGLFSISAGSPLEPPPTSSPANPPSVAVPAQSNDRQPTVPTYNINQPLLQPTGNLENDVRAVADRVRPGVVFVGIEANIRNFSQPVPVGNGSGVIIDPQGHILTNNHVVESAQALQVTLPDGRSFKANVVGTDPSTDLAVIQIQGSNLPVIPLGDSSKLQVGDWVIAIGNALGLEGGPTVTGGVVSALNRTIDEENGASIYGLIQTDAAINPGNSGGPLVNLNGEVVGINTAVPGATSQGYQPYGIGFAISINEAKPIIQQLIQNAHVTRPYLGISAVTVTPAIAAQLGVNADQGVVIANVASSSPAAQAGLAQGDVITAIDGKPIKDEASLRQAIQAHQIGDTIQLTILRNGRQMKVSAKLAQAPTS